jgi:FkbM family methyltransferase
MMSNWPRRIARFAFGKVLPKGYAYPVVRGPLRGFRFILGAAAGAGGGASILFGLAEPEQIQAFTAAVKPGQIVFDVGANVGYYTLLGSRLVGANGLVLSIEPACRNIHYLYRHLKLNSIKNVIILPSACSDDLGVASFSLGENCAIGHLQEIAGEQVKRCSDKTLVPTVTIDSITEHIGLPDVIKIDVEGAEFQVLQGGQHTLAEARPSIFLSTHSAETQLQCLRYLESMDYTIAALDNHGQKASEYYAIGH